MNDKLVLSIVSNFRTHFDLGSQLGQFDNYNESVFYKIINSIKGFFPNVDLNDEIITTVKKIIDSEFQIYQPDGTALLDDYEHQRYWYDDIKDDINHFYWPRYRSSLVRSGWSVGIVNQLDSQTLNNLMNYIGDPNAKESFSRKGLVMGDVQSGKTSNYIGLICKAADAGYKVIILLTGVLESLRRQTQIRVEEGFIGYDVENKKWVGVGVQSSENNVIPKSETSRVNDFTGLAGENTLHQITNEKVPFIFITKKNSKTLRKIRTTLSNINLIPPQNKIKSSLLVIDDEADNASINTNIPENDPTIINSEIRKLLNLFTKSNYVGFTATPFANVFIDPDSETEMLKDDLFPKHFIYNLHAPSNYFGANKMFIDKTFNTVQLIEDSDSSFPLKHKKDWDGNSLFPSLIEAINAFLIINALRDLRERTQSNSHRSMLINISRFIKVQERIEEIITNLFENILNAIKQSHKLNYQEYSKNIYILNLINTYEKHYSIFYTWEDVFSVLYNSVKDIKIYKIPFKDKKKQLDYDKHSDEGLRVIVIGGLALSRGLTLEGLTISYLYRNTSTFDVLMQMGRWFGYRHKPVEYSDLCKVWMLEQTKEYFEEIAHSINQLKRDFDALQKSNKTPKDFGIRVRNESEKLGITGRNKMRNSKKYVYTDDLFGQVLETPFISSVQSEIIHNMNTISSFLEKISLIYVDKKLYHDNVNADEVTKLLSELNIHEANYINYFQKEQIIEFIKDYGFKSFNLVVFNGDGRKFNIGNYTIDSIERSFDLLDKHTIRIGGTKRRLGGKQDTRYGLDDSIVKIINQEGSVSNKSYMIEGRNPILMIYPITLKEPIITEDPYFSDDELAMMKSIISNQTHKDLFPIGIGVGFPQNSKQVLKKKKVFYINDRTKWWNLMLDKDNQEDE